MAEKKTRSYKTRTMWTDHYEEMLINLWSEKIPDLQVNRKNLTIMQEIADRLRYEGCKVTAVEVKTKIHNLKAKYRAEKASPYKLKWPFFSKIQRIIDNFKISKVESLVGDAMEDIKLEATEELAFGDESITMYKTHIQKDYPLQSPYPVSYPAEESTINPQSPNSFPSTSTRRKRQFSFNEEILNMIRKVDEQMKIQNEDQRKYDKQIYELEVNKIRLMKEFVDTTRELKNAFVDYLRRT